MDKVLYAVFGGFVLFLLGIIFRQGKDLKKKEEDRQKLASMVVEKTATATQKTMQAKVSEHASALLGELEELDKARALATAVAKATVPVYKDGKDKEEKSCTESIEEDRDAPLETFTVDDSNRVSEGNTTQGAQQSPVVNGTPLPDGLKNIASASARRVTEHEKTIFNIINGD